MSHLLRYFRTKLATCEDSCFVGDCNKKYKRLGKIPKLGKKHKKFDTHYSCERSNFLTRIGKSKRIGIR